MQRRHLPNRQADRTDLVSANPNAGVFAPSFGFHAEARACLDRGALECANERHDFAKAFETANRVDDQLSRSVIGYVASAFDCRHIDAATREFRAVEQHVLPLRLAAERYNR